MWEMCVSFIFMLIFSYFFFISYSWKYDFWFSSLRHFVFVLLFSSVLWLTDWESKKKKELKINNSRLWFTDAPFSSDVDEFLVIMNIFSRFYFVYSETRKKKRFRRILFRCFLFVFVAYTTAEPWLQQSLYDLINFNT